MESTEGISTLSELEQKGWSSCKEIWELGSPFVKGKPILKDRAVEIIRKYDVERAATVPLLPYSDRVRFGEVENGVGAAMLKEFASSNSWHGILFNEEGVKRASRWADENPGLNEKDKQFFKVFYIDCYMRYLYLTHPSENTANKIRGEMDRGGSPFYIR